jgi:hypothetical protein
MPANGPEEDQRQFVILRRYRDLPDAVVFKSILDSAAIECLLSDENLIRMDWFWSGLLGWVKLWVRQRDVEQAEELIHQTPLEGFYVEGAGEYNQPRCPKCQSFDISYKELVKRVAFVSAYFGLPMPLKRRGWKCHSCGHSWRQFDEKVEPHTAG